MTVSIAKQKVLDELDHELSIRITRLRDTCAHMSRSLSARTELQLANLPKGVREMSMIELISSGKTMPQAVGPVTDNIGTQAAQVSKRTLNNSPIRAVKKGRIEKAGAETKKLATKRVKRG